LCLIVFCGSFLMYNQSIVPATTKGILPDRLLIGEACDLASAGGTIGGFPKLDEDPQVDNDRNALSCQVERVRAACNELRLEDRPVFGERAPKLPHLVTLYTVILLRF
jgi:hypothetical protein